MSSIAVYLTFHLIFHGAPSRPCFISMVRKMPRKKGTMNNKNDHLINIVEKILPHGQITWEAIATAYQKQMNEKEL
jgi:hypothetical protein